MVTFRPDDSIAKQVEQKYGGSVDRRKIVSADRVVNGNQMTETAKNEFGETVKISVFIDRDGDGHFKSQEAVSVKYFNPASRSDETTEYRDTDGDGFSDTVITSDWTGNETIRKESGQSTNQRMSNRYGRSWDANSPSVFNQRPLLDKNGNPVHYN